MKKISINKLKFIPASHEDPESPGALKKILYTFKDFSDGGRLQMINWACLPKDSKFIPHYHDDMDEVFIIISGKAKIKVGDREDILERGDAVFIPMKTVHQMQNLEENNLEYIVIGVSRGKSGQTHVI